MARAAVLARRTLADVATNTLSVLVLLVTGLIIGLSCNNTWGEVAWSLAIIAVFAPLAVSRYRRTAGH